LWDVNDASTSRLMSDFYARWVQHPADGKAEALRQAQLALLHSSSSAAGATTSMSISAARISEPSISAKARNAASADKSVSAAYSAGYSHPFFWAPFVLIGNYH
jgi:CHAT domain-containing protein